MLKWLLFILMFVSFLGFLFFTFLGGIIGSYAIEFHANPSIFQKTAYAFQHSNYPYVAVCFFIWFVLTLFFFKKQQEKCES
ncbi:hypothetical protein DRW41_16125 [Neobacillus piezotolerans]|uniref:Uncharacterized protein n=1 Tax=Neobacillus piezotolerans TaxID=2259171 RepID=A0A3D8GN25_9BACI|nr:hypothetical protein DRW41_16125 [Neobacillus piezotolerans]